MRLYTSELVKKYKARTVVNHVSIDVNQGEIVGLLGPNGAGKTTTFYMIVGLIKPNEGQIFLEDDNGQVAELTKEPVYRRAQMGVGYLAQEASVFRRLSVEDNIKAVLEMTDLKKDEQAARCEALIEEFRLQKVRKSLGIQLSGGERRRTEIARAVAINPAFILLDEPFAGVDPIAVEDIQSIVATLKNKNIGVIITDHNVDETLAITDRTYLLFGGFGRGAGCRPDGPQGLSGTALRTAAQSDARQTPQGTTRERSRRESVRGEIDRTRLLSGNARRIGLAESARLLPTTVRTRTGIRNRFPPAASAPPGKPGKSETKSGKDCGLATDSGSASRKKQTDNHFRTPVCIVQFARIIPDSENGKRNNDFLTSAATD